MKAVFSYGSLLILFLISVAIALVSGQYLYLAPVGLVALLMAGLSKPAWIFFLLLFSIPLSTEFQFNPSLGTDIPDEFLMWLLCPVLVFIVLQNKSLVKQLLNNKIALLILVSFCWTFITAILSAMPLVSFKYLLAKAWYIIPFVVGTQLYFSRKNEQFIGASLLASALLFTVGVILIRHSQEGFSFEKINAVTAPFYRNHVNYGALVVCTIPVVWALIRSGYRFWILGLMVLIAGLIFSYSRGAWLALGVAIIMVFVVKMGKLQWLIAVSMIAIFLASGWLLNENRYLQYRPQYEKTIYHASFDEHMAATYKMQDMSTVERFYRWIAATKMAREHWLTGTGPNSFYPLYKSYTANDFQTYVSRNNEKSTVHNYFLLLLTEQGIPGLLLFIGLLVTMMLTAQKIYHRSDDRHTRGLMQVIVAVLGMISVLIFLSDLIETDKIGSVFYLCAGLLISATKPTSAPDVQGIP